MENQDNSCEMDEALDLMEYANGSARKSWRSLEKPHVREACEDLMMVRYALQAREAASHVDVEAELERSKARWKHRRMLVRRRWIGGAVAALVVGLIFYAGFHLAYTSPSDAGVTVFVADTHKQHIVLNEEGGKRLILDEEKTKAEQFRKTAPRILDYTLPLADAFKAGEVQHVQTHSIDIPRGETFKLVLGDGTEVWLNAHSKLTYPTAFTGSERTVFLEGEAYFKVTKSRKPFVVQTASLTTKVLGTEFNVNSYGSEGSHVTLISGKVQVCSIHSPNNQCVELEPGKDARLLDDGSFEVKEANCEAYTYWRDGYFYFDGQPLVDIMKAIGDWYNVNVVFRNKEAMDYRMYFMSNRQRGIEETMLLMNRLKKVTLTLADNTVYVD